MLMRQPASFTNWGGVSECDNKLGQMGGNKFGSSKNFSFTLDLSDSSHRKSGNTGASI